MYIGKVYAFYYKRYKLKTTINFKQLIKDNFQNQESVAMMNQVNNYLEQIFSKKFFIIHNINKRLAVKIYIIYIN